MGKKNLFRFKVWDDSGKPLHEKSDRDINKLKENFDEFFKLKLGARKKR